MTAPITATAIAAIMALPAATAEAERPPAMYRDNWGMAHVYADREEDGFFALGYATAADRLEQILFKYLMVTGRLSATFGRTIDAADGVGENIAAAGIDPLASDRQLLQFRYYEQARANFARLPAAVRRDAASYVAGIERFMADNADRRPRWAPKLDPAMVAAYHAYETISWPDAEPSRQCMPDAQATASEPLESNVWAVAPNRSAEGVATLASDSHAGIPSPLGTHFYSWRLKAGSVNMFGIERAGMMYPHSGHSDRIAWAWTFGLVKTADCYALPLDPARPGHVLIGETSRSLLRKVVDIPVAGGAPVRARFDYVRVNGVLSPVTRRADGRVYVFNSPYHSIIGLSLAQARAMMVARSMPAFRRALAMQYGYAHNLVAASAAGDIFYIRTGRTPVRPWQSDPAAVVDGSDGLRRWRGIHRLSELPQVLNPGTGYLINNNVSPDRMWPHSPMTRDRYPAYFGISGETTPRQARALEMLGGSSPLPFADIFAAMMDEKLAKAELWAGAFGQLTLPPSGDDNLLRPFLAELQRFDGIFAAGSRGALYHVRVREALMTEWADSVDRISETIEAERPLDAADRAILKQAVMRAHARIVRENGRIDIALGDVLRLGRGPVDYPAGGIRLRAGFRRTLGGVPLATAGEAGGDYAIASTLRLWDYAPPGRDGRQHAVGGQRIPFIVSFTSPITSLAGLAWGLSDDPGSPHYADQAALLSARRLRPTYFDRDALVRVSGPPTLLHRHPKRSPK